MSETLEQLRAEAKDNRHGRRGMCAHCGEPSEVYLQVNIKDPDNGAKVLRSKQLTVCALCATSFFSEFVARQNGRAS